MSMISRLTVHLMTLHASCSCNKDASTTGLRDSLLGSLGEEFGLDNDGDLGELTLAEDLEVTLQ